MYGRLKTATLGAVVVAAALVPLFGDPRQTPVTHAIWGRMLLRALDMNEAVRESTQASQVFATLTWRDSLTLTADRFSKGDGVAVKDEGGVRRVMAGSSPGEVVYPLAVVQGGDYRFRARLAGDGTRPASAEIAPAGGRAFKTFTLAAGETGRKAAPRTSTPAPTPPPCCCRPGCGLERLEVAPPCVASVEPAGGWHAHRGDDRRGRGRDRRARDGPGKRAASRRAAAGAVRAPRSRSTSGWPRARSSRGSRPSP